MDWLNARPHRFFLKVCAPLSDRDTAPARGGRGASPTPSRQLRPRGSDRQSNAETRASVPFLKMQTYVTRHVSFLDGPVAFCGGRKGRVETNQGGPGSPLGGRAPGASIWSFSHQKLADSSHSTASLLETRQGCLFFPRGLKRSLFYCKSKTCSLFRINK